MADRRRDAQLELFTSTGQGESRNPAVEPARVGAEVAGLADRLPPGLRLGTSSWSFPGWAGSVYQGPARGQPLARSGLATHAQHPLLRSVGIDRSFYGPLGQAEYAAYASAVPDDFRFLVKAHQALTLARFPHHARYGAQAGEPNPLYLDAGYARERARKRYAPFDRLVDEDPTTRSSLARICLERARRARRCTSSLTTRPRGSAPLSAFAVAAAIVTAAKT